MVKSNESDNYEIQVYDILIILFFNPLSAFIFIIIAQIQQAFQEHRLVCTGKRLFFEKSIKLLYSQLGTFLVFQIVKDCFHVARFFTFDVTYVQHKNCGRFKQGSKCRGGVFDDESKSPTPNQLRSIMQMSYLTHLEWFVPLRV